MRIRTALGGATLILALTFGSSLRAAPVSIYCELAESAAARVEQYRGSKIRSDKLAFRAFKKVVRLAEKKAPNAKKEFAINVKLARHRWKKFNRATGSGKKNVELVELDQATLNSWIRVDYTALGRCRDELVPWILQLEVESAPESIQRATKAAEELDDALGELLDVYSPVTGGDFLAYSEAVDRIFELKSKFEHLASRASKDIGGGLRCTGAEAGEGSATFGDGTRIQFEQGGGLLESDSGLTPGSRPADSRTLLATLLSADGQDVNILAFLSNPKKTGKVTLSQGEFEITLRLNDDGGVRNYVARVEAPQIVMTVKRSEACSGTRLFEFELEGIPVTVYHTSSPFVPVDTDILDLIVLVEARD